MKKTNTTIDNKKITKKDLRKKNAIDKKTTKKLAPDCKALMKQAKKLFGDARKNVSALKKVTKCYGKLVTETLKSGDEKTLNKIQKLFSYAGYKLSDDKASVQNVIVGKVKVPKIHKVSAKVDATADVTTVAKPKRKYVRKTQAKVEKPSEVVTTVEVIDPPKPTEEPTPSVDDSEEPSEEELAEIEKEISEDPLGEMDDSESETQDEDDEDSNDMDTSIRDRADSDAEIFEAMRENGDCD